MKRRTVPRAEATYLQWVHRGAAGHGATQTSDHCLPLPCGSGEELCSCCYKSGTKDSRVCTTQRGALPPHIPQVLYMRIMGKTLQVWKKLYVRKYEIFSIASSHSSEAPAPGVRAFAPHSSHSYSTPEASTRSLKYLTFTLA